MLQNPGVFNIFASRHSRVPVLNIGTSKIASANVVFFAFWLEMCFAPQPRAIFEHRNFQNRLCECGVFCILTCTCASRHSRVPFLNIGTSKMAPRMWCFVHFDLNMCFAPQPRAIFQHRNFKNGSDNEVFCAFWLANVLRGTAACYFSPVCQNSYLRTRRFSEPTFRTSGTTNHWFAGPLTFLARVAPF